MSVSKLFLPSTFWNAIPWDNFHAFTEIQLLAWSWCSLSSWRRTSTSRKYQIIREAINKNQSFAVISARSSVWKTEISDWLGRKWSPPKHLNWNWRALRCRWYFLRWLVQEKRGLIVNSCILLFHLPPRLLWLTFFVFTGFEWARVAMVPAVDKKYGEEDHCNSCHYYGNNYPSWHALWSRCWETPLLSGNQRVGLDTKIPKNRLKMYPYNSAKSSIIVQE